VDQADLDLRSGELLQGAGDRLQRALHVGLHDQRQGAHFALSHLLEHILQLGRLLLGQLHIAELALTEQGDLARLLLVGQHQEIGTRRRHLGQALDLHRDGGTGFVDHLTVLVQHRTHTAGHGTH
jgi:hypothetical protein